MLINGSENELKSLKSFIKIVIVTSHKRKQPFSLFGKIQNVANQKHS